MAEINVERRKKKPVWPWIIGLIVVLILIWLIYETFVDSDTANDPEGIETPVSDSIEIINTEDTIKVLREMDTIQVDTTQ